MFNPDVWSWPQWSLIILMFLGLVIAAADHGKDKKPEKHNAFVAMCRFTLWTFLLIFGGFYA